MPQIPSSLDEISDSRQLSFSDRIVFHCKQQPIVPLGLFLTTAAVVIAAKNVRSDNKKLTHLCLRLRVGIQAATILALVSGSFIYGIKRKDRESKDEILRQKAKKREQLWIEELERRTKETENKRKRAELAFQKVKEAELEKELEE